jgi:16S rRNA processing protein RimM
VIGHRGRGGELTVKVGGGDAALWSPVRRVFVGPAPDHGRHHDVEHARSYRDRLVLKLGGIDDANAAARLRGALVAVDEADAPALAPGRFYAERLVGLAVVDERGREIGRVEDVLPTGGTDVLVIRTAAREELMLPFAREFLVEVAPGEGRLVVRWPAGLPGPAGSSG